MTTRVGILEWLNNTKPLKAIIEDEINKENRRLNGHNVGELNIMTIPAGAYHNQWLKGYAKHLKGKKAGNR